MTTTFTPRRRQRGLSMIEILVALTIVAFGLLGLAGLQARSMSFQKDSFDRKAAAEVAAQLSERIRANYSAFVDGNYTRTMLPGDQTPVGVTPCASPQNCSPAEIANRDWDMWRMEIRRRLPVSAAYITTGAGPVPSQLTVILAWQEGRAAGQDQTVDLVCQSVNLDPSFRCMTWNLHP